MSLDLSSITYYAFGGFFFPGLKAFLKALSSFLLPLLFLGADVGGFDFGGDFLFAIIKQL